MVSKQGNAELATAEAGSCCASATKFSIPRVVQPNNVPPSKETFRLSAWVEAGIFGRLVLGTTCLW